MSGLGITGKSITRLRRPRRPYSERERDRSYFVPQKITKRRSIVRPDGRTYPHTIELQHPKEPTKEPTKEPEPSFPTTGRARLPTGPKGRPPPHEKEYNFYGTDAPVHPVKERETGRRIAYRYDFRHPSEIAKIGFQGMTATDVWNASHRFKGDPPSVPVSSTKGGADFYAHELSRTHKLKDWKRTIYKYEVDITGLDYLDLTKYHTRNPVGVMDGKSSGPQNDLSLPPKEIREMILKGAKTEKERAMNTPSKDRKDSYGGTTPESFERFVKEQGPKMKPGYEDDVSEQLNNLSLLNREITILERIDPHRITFIGAHEIDNLKITHRKKKVDTNLLPLRKFLELPPEEKRRQVEKERTKMRQQKGVILTPHNTRNVRDIETEARRTEKELFDQRDKVEANERLHNPRYETGKPRMTKKELGYDTAESQRFKEEMKQAGSRRLVPQLPVLKDDGR